MLTSKLSKRGSYAHRQEKDPTPFFGELRDADPVLRQTRGSRVDPN